MLAKGATILLAEMSCKQSYTTENKCLLFSPTLSRRSLRDLRPPLRRYLRRPRSAAFLAERLGGRVFAVIRRRIVNLAGRDLGDHDGAGVYVGGAALAFRSAGHSSF